MQPMCKVCFLSFLFFWGSLFGGGASASSVSLYATAEDEGEVFSGSSVKGECLPVCSSEKIEEGRRFLTGFYRKYISIFLTTCRPEPLDSLLETVLTPACSEKLDGMGYAVGADPVIRAQDSNEEALRSLSVRNVQGLWYEVSYAWTKNEPCTRIPVRLTEDGSAWKILYITPDYWDNRATDSLFYVERPVCPVDSVSPIAFVRSFYAAYTAEHATLQPGAAGRLAALRNRWLTPEARARFLREEEAWKLDGTPDYDLLISGFFFDRLQQAAMRITQVGDRTFHIFLPFGFQKSEAPDLILTLKPVGASYLIDSLERGE